MQGTGVWSGFKLKRDDKEDDAASGKGDDKSGKPQSPPRG